MKILVAVISVLAVSTVQAALRISEIGPKLQALAGPLHSYCAFRTRVLPSSINNVINGVFIDEPFIKAYMSCIFREAKLMNDFGEFNFEQGAYLLPEDIKDEAISNAKYCDEVGKVQGIRKPEDRLFALLRCYYDLDPDIFIFF